jgi:hypothetical protein
MEVYQLNKHIDESYRFVVGMLKDRPFRLWISIMLTQQSHFPQKPAHTLFVSVCQPSIERSSESLDAF